MWIRLLPWVIGRVVLIHASPLVSKIQLRQGVGSEVFDVCSGVDLAQIGLCCMISCAVTGSVSCSHCFSHVPVRFPFGMAMLLNIDSIRVIPERGIFCRRILSRHCAQSIWSVAVLLTTEELKFDQVALLFMSVIKPFGLILGSNDVIGAFRDMQPHCLVQPECRHEHSELLPASRSESSSLRAWGSGLGIGLGCRRRCHPA